MSRARNIKPGFFKNDELAQCEYGARLLFAGLWTMADREGRLEDRPLRIKGELFPYDNCDVEVWLSQLSEGGFIRRYEVDGRKYIQVSSFRKHQNPHIKEPASIIPAPCAHQTGTSAAVLIPDSGFLIPDSTTPESGAGVSREVIDEFIAAWNATPGVVRCRELSDARVKAIRTRMKNQGWAWRDALKRFPLKCFANDPEGWKPDLDWFLKPDNVTKILEGKYDWEKKDGKQRTLAGGAGQTFAASAEDPNFGRM